MRVQFRAHDAGVSEEDDAFSCGLGGNDAGGREHYLTLQIPAAEAGPSDSSIYIELDDQLHSGYDAIRQCRLSRDLLSVDLRKPLGGLADVDGFDVSLALADAAYTEMRRALERMFRRAPDKLILA